MTLIVSGSDHCKHILEEGQQSWRTKVPSKEKITIDSKAGAGGFHACITVKGVALTDGRTLPDPRVDQLQSTEAGRLVCAAVATTQGVGSVMEMRSDAIEFTLAAYVFPSIGQTIFAAEQNVAQSLRYAGYEAPEHQPPKGAELVLVRSPTGNSGLLALNVELIKRDHKVTILAGSSPAQLAHPEFTKPGQDISRIVGTTTGVSRLELVARYHIAFRFETDESSRVMEISEQVLGRVQVYLKEGLGLKIARIALSTDAG